MYIEVFNKDFERIAICDDYESLIWTDRYNEPGDFELSFGMRKDLLDIYAPDNYLVSRDSEYTMIIEGYKIETDLEGGNHLIVRGRSLESVLCRRIVWKQTTVKGNLQRAVRRLIEENVTGRSNLDIGNRRIPNFVFQENTDGAVDSLRIDETQFTGDVLYDALKAICDVHDVGFSLKKNERNEFIFQLYVGQDRAYNQPLNTYVVFSPNFDNLISSDYDEDKTKYCNVTLVAGEGEGNERKTTTVGDLEVWGLERRELFTDARDISSKTEDEEGNSVTLDEAEYIKALKTRGLEKLKEAEIEKTFDGQVEATQQYKYGQDFFLGDLCQLENEYGQQTKVKVMEYIHSESTSGIEEYPTFKVVEEEEE